MTVFPDPADPAPWWIREIRTYGISALFAVAVGWFAYQQSENHRADLKERDAVTNGQFAIMHTILDNNTKAAYESAKALYELSFNVRKNNELLENAPR